MSQNKSPMSSVKSNSNDGGSIKEKVGGGSQGSFSFPKKFACKVPYPFLHFLI